MVKPFHEMFIEKLPSLIEKLEIIRLQTETEGDYSLNIQFSKITINYNTATGDLMIITPEKMSKYNHKNLSFYFSDLMNGKDASGEYPKEFINKDKKLLNDIKREINKGIISDILKKEIKTKEEFNKLKQEDEKRIRNTIILKTKKAKEQYIVKNPKKILEELLKGTYELQRKTKQENRIKRRIIAKRLPNDW